MSNAFMDWLEERNREVLNLEARGGELLDTGDAGGYRRVMREKAELLADLADDGSGKLFSLPEAMRPAVRERLAAFAFSAGSALELDSVFYMSALLYPEDHRKGQPNDLQAFADDLKRKLAGR